MIIFRKRFAMIWTAMAAYLLIWFFMLFRLLGNGNLATSAFYVMSVFAALDALVMIIACYVLIRRYWDVENENAENKVRYLEQQLQSNEERLNALQSQINPHFLYNTLDTIRAMAVEKKEKEISDIVGSLSLMFRYNMDFADSVVPLSLEISQIKRYMNIQQLRFPGRFIFREKLDCSEEDFHQVQLPKFSIQPIIENAISHGFKGKDQNCELTVSYISLGDRFQIEVRDNGRGISEDDTLRINNLLKTGNSSDVDVHNGIALNNIYSRLKLYFGQEAEMYIQSTVGIGTIVIFSFPIISK